MAITHLLRQTVTISTASGSDKYGKATYGAPATTKARFQQTSRSMVTAQNERQPIDGIVFLKLGTVVNIDDRLTYSGTNYRVMSVQPIIGRWGAIHHIEVMVQKWAV